MYYGGWTKDQLTKPPLFGLPTVYCVNTKQFLCAYAIRSRSAIRARGSPGAGVWSAYEVRAEAGFRGRRRRCWGA